MTTWIFDPVTDEAVRDHLEITLRFDGDVTVCALDGPLCAYTAPVLDGWLGQLHENDRHHVIVDVTGVPSVSSDGVDVLAHHAERFRAVGGALQVRAPSVVARRVLDLCDAGELVEVDRAG